MGKELFGTRNAFVNVAWAFVLYLIGVILFGAWVRITGSGAGCGSHWPTCHGEVIPTAPSTKTIIEFTHRLTSGACGIFGIGAGIVLKELVENDTSVARAIVISLHLVNTLMLTGSASLTAWWAGGHELPDPKALPKRAAFAVLALIAIAATSMTGAITALGDTLFPVDPATSGHIFAHVNEGLSSANHFLVRLRVVHPIIAVTTAFGLLAFANHVGTSERASLTARRWAILCAVAVCAEVALGLLNVILHAPGVLQLSHLFVAQWVWVSTLLMASAFTTPERS